MATVKIVNSRYYKKNSMEYVINYATNPQKTDGIYIGSLGTNACDPEKMINQMINVKKGFDKVDGYRQLRHFIVSFQEDEKVTVEMAYFMAYDIARFYSDKYQICFGVHKNTDNLHIHFVQNTVCFINGRLFSGGPDELRTFKNHVNSVTATYLARSNPVQRQKYLKEFLGEDIKVG